MRSFDLAIRCERILPMSDPAATVLENQLLGISGGRISALEPWSAPGTTWQAKRLIEAAGQLVMPGLINGHCHLPMSLFRGLADDLPFEQWLHEIILPLEARLVSPEMCALGTELSLLEQLLSGTTTTFDMFYFEESIAEVVDRVGSRAVLGETVIDYIVPDTRDRPGEHYRILDRMVEKYRGHARITPVVAPHATYSCSDDTFRQAVAFAEKRDVGLAVHVSEPKSEFEESKKKYGLTPVERMQKLGVTGPRTLFAHVVHATEKDIEILAQTGTSVVHNPECNMKIATGVAPVPRFLAQGVTVGLGTDGPASNNDLSLFKEMDMGAKLHKLHAQDNTAVTARTLLRMATLEGARALKLGDEVGSLEVGKRADVVILNLEVPQLQPLHDVASALVYAANGSEVDTVICEGKILVEKRQALTINQEELFQKIRRFRKAQNF